MQSSPKPHADGLFEKAVLVVSSDPALGGSLTCALNDHGVEAVVEETWRRARRQLAAGGLAAIVIDLPAENRDEEYSECLRDLATDRQMRPPVVVLSADGAGCSLAEASLVDALQARVLRRSGRIGDIVDRLLESVRQHRAQVPTAAAEPHILAGRTVKFETRVTELFSLLEDVKLAAVHDVTILLVGETGSGKTTLAKLIHELSPRFRERFMPLACGALQPTLIESELFGHEKGAFTGADRAKIGKFEAVGPGTLLLDEIDSLTLEQQVKLLRVIETGEFEPVGSNDTRTSAARLIVASNVCLDTLVANNRFRKDLYYRLNVLKFHVPALRERVPDIVPIALGFVDEICGRCAVPIRAVHPGFLASLRSYHWPGNLRELKNCMERAVVLCRDGELTPACLPPAIAQSEVAYHPAETAATLMGQVARSEQSIIEEALRRHKNKRTAAARELGISRVTLYNKMKKYQMLDAPRRHGPETLAKRSPHQFVDDLQEALRV